eukprot:c16743_g1_i1.p1 GENE.c16743_g1_i1~~c16743_g1_i1.p1  ORF type:complete len:417 (+),score=48.06 c16743_g1_i1:75-1253(+)
MSERELLLRTEALEASFAEWRAEPPETSAPRASRRVRQIYRSIEELRIDTEMWLLANPSQSNEALVERQLVMHRACHLTAPPPGSNIPKIFRAVAVIIFVFLVCVPILTVLLPLRLLHPLLRMVGIPNGYLPLDLAIKCTARCFLLLFSVTVVSEGDAALPLSTSVLALYSHSSNLDPFLLQAASPILFKYIGKRSLFLIPLWGWLMRAYGNISIDRSNRERAIRSLAKAKAKMMRWRRSIALAPEGTRSETGLLLDFKKGSFHLAAEIGVPIQPSVIFGAYELWPPGSWFPAPGLVTVRFLAPIDVDPTVRSTDELRCVVRRAMIAAIDQPPAYYRMGDSETAIIGTVYPLLSWAFVGLMLTAVPVVYWYWIWPSLAAGFSWLMSFVLGYF